MKYRFYIPWLYSRIWNGKKRQQFRWDQPPSILKSLGVSVTATSTYSVVAKGEDTVTYPMLVSSDQVVKTIEVPRDWDNHRLHARDVLSNVTENLGKIPGVIETQLEAGDTSVGGLSKLKIVLLYDEDNPPGIANIPSKKEGIQIDTRPMPEYGKVGHQCSDETTADNCGQNQATDTVPGGYMFGSDRGYGSSCCRVTVDGKERMLTVAHSFVDNCSSSRSDTIGTTAKVNGTVVGSVSDTHLEEDWAIVEPDSSATFQSHIDDAHSNPTVNGYVTRATLDIWMSDTNYTDPCLENMGRSTGHTTGKIQATGVSHTNTCTDYSGEGVKTYCNLAGGDSGSPTYFISNGDAYIVSVTGYGYNVIGYVCNASRRQYGNSGGTGAYQLANQRGIEFGSNTAF